MDFTRTASLLAASSFALLVACSAVPPIVREYRIDVQQGNVLTQEMVAQLRPGLSRDQVRFVLGTPVLMDMFHAERWDYFYWLQKGNTGAIDKRRFSVFFDADGKLIRVAGDVTPAAADELTASATPKNKEIDLGSLPSPEGRQANAAPGEKGFFARALERLGL